MIELGVAVFCPIVTVPVEVPVFIVVLKLLLSLRETAAPVAVIPNVGENNPEEPNVVKFPAAGVPLPIAAGAAKVVPFRSEAFRFVTAVVDATVKGAVPVARVLVITPVALTVVKAPAAGELPPIAGGEAR